MKNKKQNEEEKKADYESLIKNIKIRHKKELKERKK